MVKSMKSGNTDGNYDEAVASLKAELAIRDEENERLTVRTSLWIIAFRVLTSSLFRNNYVRRDYKQEENNSL